MNRVEGEPIPLEDVISDEIVLVHFRSALGSFFSRAGYYARTCWPRFAEGMAGRAGRAQLPRNRSGRKLPAFPSEQQMKLRSAARSGLVGMGPARSPTVPTTPGAEDRLDNSSAGGPAGKGLRLVGSAGRPPVLLADRVGL